MFAAVLILAAFVIWRSRIARHPRRSTNDDRH
jgi:hypothetical protein